MPHTASDGVSIYYDTTGTPGDEPLMLVEGFGQQSIWSRDEFVGMLAAESFYVIRMDNRDTGMSQKFGGPDDLDGGYELADMALDVLRVQDAVGISSAHVVGKSMGGMIAQMIALEHPERLRSMTLVFSLPGQDPRYMGEPIAPPTEPAPRLTREQYIPEGVAFQRSIHAGSYEFDEDWVLERAGLFYDRGYSPDGQQRQWHALLRAPERLERLRSVRTPTLLIHGRDDPVVSWVASADMAEAIPDAEFHLYPGMAHEMHRELWPSYVAEIVRVAQRA